MEENSIQRKGERDQECIRDLISRWGKATTEGDLSQILPLMDEDVIFLTPGNPPMRGRQAFAESFREIVQQIRIEVESDVREISIRGDWAWCWNYLLVTTTPLSGGPSTSRGGDTLTILQKKSDGNWVIIRDANMLAEIPGTL